MNMRISKVIRMLPILQKKIPFDAMNEPKLPGINPLNPDAWLMIDDAYGAQMALRETLIKERRDACDCD
jgi:hypothetical protein